MTFNSHHFKDGGLDAGFERIMHDTKVHLRSDPMEQLNFLMIGGDILMHTGLEPYFRDMFINRPWKRKSPAQIKKLGLRHNEEPHMTEGLSTMTVNYKVSRHIFRLTVVAEESTMYRIKAHALNSNEREIFLGGPEAPSIREATANALAAMEALIKKHGNAP